MDLSGSVEPPIVSGNLAPGSGTVVRSAGPGAVYAGLTLIAPFPLPGSQFRGSATTLTVSITVSA